ncbi:MAG TPA: response regulator [Polyangiaceae bacterium]|nr:response regulator [Polyangiaceae bacterium]
MSSSASEARDTAGGRLGGARADFVASLGRKVSDARELLNALEEDPSSKAARDELRRRLHALGSGARLLRFEAMARSLQEVLSVLDRGAQAGGLREEEVGFIAQVLDDLPALAWGEPSPREAAARVTSLTEEAEDAPGLPPISVLVIGPAALADALTEEAVARSRAFECERTDDAQAALQLARAYAPDLVLIDADHEQSLSLVEALVDDPMTEPVPVIVIGTYRTPEEASRFIALGVAKTLTRPVSPDMIRHACDEVLDAREGRTVRMTLGEPTLEQLAERLSQELKSALIEGVDPTARFTRVPLGEGTEVLGALWGAIARVQEIVSQRTKGAIRFGGDTPEGAIALAPWLHQDLPGADRMAGRGRGAAADVRLNGRRVVVADDDPGVTWFISDLLRTAGCEVHEALDGATALDIAFRVQPELVVSDILMPGLDGFALCRALRRDVGLRDTPVMLLSWKEDLLQRVRELGASAAAYMRKESDSRAVLARVREVLRPRARIEMRLRGDGEVRGRLDDLSPRLLLELVCAIRKDARVAVRDATFLYEVEIRGGAPRKATRTASDGSFQSGERALAMLLAVGAGRFSIASSQEPIRGELSGTLFDLLARPLAMARGALAATTGAKTMEVERILLEASVLEEYLRATPDPARAVLKRLAAGASPRSLLLAGEAAPSLVEDLLADLAARGAIRAVEAADGTDLLTPAIDAALAVLTGAVPSSRSMPPNARPSIAPRPQTVLARRAPEPARAPEPIRVPEPVQAPAPERAPDRPAHPTDPPMRALESLQWSAPPEALKPESVRPSTRLPAGLASALAPPSRVIDDDNDSDAPSSLEDAVMREISERYPEPSPVLGGLDLPPIVEPSALRPRSSNPPANEETSREPVDEQALLPSIPPDAIVPAATSNEEFAVAAPVFGDVITSQAEEVFQLTSERRLVSREARDLGLVPGAAPEAGDDARPEAATLTREKEDAEREGVVGRGEDAPAVAMRETEGESRAAIAGASPPIISLPPDDLHEVVEEPQRRAAPASEAPAPTSSSWGLVVAFALLAGAVVGVLRMTTRDVEPPHPTPGPSASAATVPSANVAPTPATMAPANPANPSLAPGVAGGAPSSGAVTTDDALPPDMAVPAGHGLLQVAAPRGAHVLIDGVDAGTGPLASSVQRAGYHQVRIDQDGKHSQFVIEVRAQKATRVKSSPLP